MSNSDIEKEFEDFVYIVSHDMAAPQRHIREFTKLLLDSFDVSLTDEQKLYRQFIEAGLTRIERMQDALLAYSRISSQGEEFKPFDGNACLARVLKRLNSLIVDSHAVVDITPFSHLISGDEGQIENVFYHLIENALLYRSDKPPIIRLEVEEEVGDRLSFSLLDNGMGIQNGQDAHIFTIFRRLHAPDACGGGVGAGLAIARKIIRRHGGELSYLSGNEGGSIFRFTLPKA